MINTSLISLIIMITCGSFGLLDGLLLLLDRRPLGSLEAVEGLGEVVLQALLLQPQLPLLRGGQAAPRGDGVQVLQILGSVLGQLTSVVLDLLPENGNTQRKIRAYYINFGTQLSIN